MLLWSATYHFLDLCRAAWPFTTDDAYITLRYAWHWAHGDGITFNAGAKPVEGYSNFAYVVVGAASLRLGIDPVVVLKGLGVLAPPLTAWLLYRIASRQVAPLWATLPGVVYLAFPGVAWWAVSGLETTVYGLAVVATVWAYDRAVSQTCVRARRRGASITGVLVAVLGLLRPEGPLVGLVLGAMTLLGLAIAWRRGRIDRARAHPDMAGGMLAGFVVPYVPYLVWRVHHFGYWLPNAAACKASHPGSPWLLILEYTPVLVVAVATLAWAGRKLSRPANLACLGINAAYLVLLYGVDTTIAYGLRHFLAAFALVLVPVAVGAAAIGRRHGGASSRGWVGMIAVHTVLWSVVSLADVDAHLRRFADGYDQRGHTRQEVATWLSDTLPQRGRFLMGDVGLTGYRTPQLHLVDAYCLNNEHMGRAPEGEEARALVAQVRAAPPAVLVVSSKSATTLRSRSESFTYILQDPELGPQYELVRTFGEDRDAFNYWVYRWTGR